jgi:chitodextrinase
LIGYTTAFKIASAPNVSATGDPPNPATGWVYATPSPTATATVVLIHSLTTDTEYSFKVKARNAEGGGEWSRTITKSTE